MNDYTSKVASESPLIAGKKYPKCAETSTLFKSFWDYLASVNLTPTQGRVLYKMLFYMDDENWVKVSQMTLAEDLKIERQNVQTAVKRLVELKIIEVLPDPQDRRRKQYRLSTRFAWNEKPKQLREHMHNSFIKDNIITQIQETEKVETVNEIERFRGKTANIIRQIIEKEEWKEKIFAEIQEIVQKENSQETVIAKIQEIAERESIRKYLIALVEEEANLIKNRKPSENVIVSIEKALDKVKTELRMSS